MTRPPMPAGPYETRQQVSAEPAVRAVYDAVRALHGPAAVGAMAPHNYNLLVNACEAASVDLGGPASYDRTILAWLARWGPETCAVVAGLITRAHATGKAGLAPEQLRIVLDALDVAADYTRDRAATCGDCDAEPEGELCSTCTWRLSLADDFDQLADRLREATR